MNLKDFKLLFWIFLLCAFVLFHYSYDQKIIFGTNLNKIPDSSNFASKVVWADPSLKNLPLILGPTLFPLCPKKCSVGLLDQEIILGFEKAIQDNPGYDIRIYEIDETYNFSRPMNLSSDRYEVLVSKDLNSWVLLGRGNGTTSFDLEKIGINEVHFVKIKGILQKNSLSKYPDRAEIDAVEIIKPLR